MSFWTAPALSDMLNRIVLWRNAISATTNTLVAINFLELLLLAWALSLLINWFPNYRRMPDSNLLLRKLVSILLRILRIVSYIRLSPMMLAPFLLWKEIFRGVLYKMRVQLRVVGDFPLPLGLHFYFIGSIHNFLVVLHWALINIFPTVFVRGNCRLLLRSLSALLNRWVSLKARRSTIHGLLRNTYISIPYTYIICFLLFLTVICILWWFIAILWACREIILWKT